MENSHFFSQQAEHLRNDMSLLYNYTNYYVLCDFVLFLTCVKAHSNKRI